MLSIICYLFDFIYYGRKTCATAFRKTLRKAFRKAIRKAIRKATAKTFTKALAMSSSQSLLCKAFFAKAFGCASERAGLRNVSSQLRKALRDALRTIL